MEQSRWVVQDKDPNVPFGQRRCLFWSDELGRFVLMRPTAGGSAAKTHPLLLGQASFDCRLRAEQALERWEKQGGIPEPPNVPPVAIKVIELRITVHEVE